MFLALRNGSSALTHTAGPVNRLSSLFDRFFNDDFFAPLYSCPTVDGSASVAVAG